MDPGLLEANVHQFHAIPSVCTRLLRMNSPHLRALLSSSSHPTEKQHDGSAISQPAGGARVKPSARPSPERALGPDVAGDKDQAPAEIHHQGLPVLPEQQALQLLHLPDCVRPGPATTSVLSPSLVGLSSANSSSSRVRELSSHFSEMNPVRQKWIYSFFMYPFLSGPDVAGKAGTSSCDGFHLH